MVSEGRKSSTSLRMHPQQPDAAPPRRKQHDPLSQHHHCCPCFLSDSSTINESDADSEDPPVLVHHGTRRSRRSHAKLLRVRHSQRQVLSGENPSVRFCARADCCCWCSVDPFDYEQKYPSDERYKEMSEKSRVWKTYMDESTKFDLDMVENWRDGLDMLLVFVSSRQIMPVQIDCDLPM